MIVATGLTISIVGLVLFGIEGLYAMHYAKRSYGPFESRSSVCSVAISCSGLALALVGLIWMTAIQ